MNLEGGSAFQVHFCLLRPCCKGFEEAGPERQASCLSTRRWPRGKLAAAPQQAGKAKLAFAAPGCREAACLPLSPHLLGPPYHLSTLQNHDMYLCSIHQPAYNC